MTTTMTASRYWIFTIVFWLIAGVLMFLSALRIDHWDQVIPRFVYFPVLGLLVTALMTLIYQSDPFRRFKRRLPLVGGICVLAALLTALVLNPLTFLLLGASMSGRHIEVISTGMLYHTLFFLLWSFLYLQFEGRSLVGSQSRSRSGGSNFTEVIAVDDRGEVKRLNVDEIEHITANGDYIDIHVPDRSHLKKGTITGLEALLDPGKFSRIHRSVIVNASKVVAINTKGSGAYELTLESGAVVVSSRSYRSVVMGLSIPN